MSLSETTRLINKSSDQRKTLIILTVSTLVYFPFIFLGYGTDSDTYRVIETGGRLVTE